MVEKWNENSLIGWDSDTDGLVGAISDLREDL